MVNIGDVAKRAGVSKTTVSHALSGKRPVAQATKEKIFRVIEQLNYVPNGIAQNLVTGKSNIISLVYPLEGGYLMSDAPSEFILSTVEAVNAQGYEFLLSTKKDPDEVVQLARRGHTDAVILMDVSLWDERVTALKNIRFPFVLIGRCQENDGLDFVDVDAQHGVHEATKHLIHLGHKKIGLLRLKPLDFGFSTRAYRGYVAAHNEAGLQVDPSLVVDTDISVDGGYRGMHALLQHNPLCTGCIVLADQVTVGAVQYCEEHQIHIPDDFSLVGFGSPHYQGLIRPPLTTVEMPAKKMTRIAVDLVVSRLRNEPLPHNQVVLTPAFIPRQSTAPPRPSSPP